MPNPPLASLTDPFTSASLNTALWGGTTPGTVNVVPSLGMAQLACPTSTGTTNVLGTTGFYDATGGALYALVTPILRGNGGTQTTMRLQLDSNNSALMRLDGGVFRLMVKTGGVFTITTLPTYDPTAHAWWRLRESSGTWYAETSPDGYAWTTLASQPYTWSPTALQAQFQTSTTDTEPSGLFAGIQNVNTPLGPDGLIPSWPQVRFQVAFNQGANTAGQPAFTDLSTRLRGSWSAELSGRQYELDQVQSGQMSVNLWNLDGALDPLNTSSPYSPNVLPLRPARMQAVWPPTRNLIPQPASNGTNRFATASQVTNTAGTFTAGVTVQPAPTGHTTAFSWSLPAGTGTSATLGVGSLASGGFAGPDESAIPVVAGATYTFTCWASLAAGGDSTLQLSPRISFYDATGTRIAATNPASGVPVAVQGAWTLLSFTVTAAAGSVNARPGIWITSVPSATTVVYTTAWQFEQAAAATPWTAGGYLYPLWQGFVERWPQQWDYSGTYGTVAITCVDALASLAQFTLQPNFQASLISLGPNFCYPLNEPSGSTTFADATGRKPARSAVPSILGAGGSVAAGQSIQGTGAVGTAGPVVTITQPVTGGGGNSRGYYIGNPSILQTPPTSGGWTRLICFRTTSAPGSGNYLTLWQSSGPGFYGASFGSQSLILLGVDSSGHGVGWISNANASATTIISVPDVVVTDGNWHIICAQLSSDGKTFTVAVDQHGYQVTTTGDYHPTGCTTDSIGAIENGSLGQFSWAFSGDVAFATEYGYALGNGNAYDLMSGFSTGWSGETSAARAQRILNIAGYQGPLSTLDATIPMGAANLAGVDAMSALQLVGDTENGQVYVDGGGTIWLAARTWRYLQTSATVTFGENAGEIPYLEDIAVELDDSHIYNDVTVQNQALPGQAEQPATHITDSTSQAAYLPRSVQRTINSQDQSMQQSAAQYLLTQYAQPLPRVSQLTLDGAANPALWSTILALGFGTRADVKRRPPAAAGAAPITVQQFIEHVTWSGDDEGNLKLGLQLSPAQPFTNWGVLASLHTTVKTASTAGAATVTLSPLTGSSLNPASAVLIAGTQLTLGYGTANAETLTVKSVAATSPGYTSVAVTFTTPTTKNHAVGEMVCQPQPGSLTLPATVQSGYPASLDAAATLSATGPRAAY